MLNPNLLKFIVKNNLEESRVEEKKEKKSAKTKKLSFGGIVPAVVAVEVKK